MPQACSANNSGQASVAISAIAQADNRFASQYQRWIEEGGMQAFTGTVPVNACEACDIERCVEGMP
jgi:hypothetical protein